ncbi:hypothetical protein ABT075_20170 [Streptomyces sp. NPDC002677]|uniref:hypothetical protein n=1 Tax=Streptomyces sp. NPDC002677 TaxID=3154774 RepID=UPI0033284960
MADDSDVLIEFWKSQCDQARQVENQRAVLTNIVILVAAAGLGFIAQQGLRPSVLVVTVPMTLLGLYGALACMKYRERNALHNAQAVSLRKKLDAMHPTVSIGVAWAEVQRDQQAKFPRLFRVRLFMLWVALHTGIAMVGCLLSVWALLL